jgi:hypothetical protein
MPGLGYPDQGDASQSESREQFRIAFHLRSQNHS